MAPYSSTLAWKIPQTEEPGGLQSMGSLSRRQLSDFTFTFHFHALEKEMATHSSTLAWRIPWREEPGRLQSMVSQRVGHDWVTSLSLSAMYESSCCFTSVLAFGVVIVWYFGLSAWYVVVALYFNLPFHDDLWWHLYILLFLRVGCFFSVEAVKILWIYMWIY